MGKRRSTNTAAASSHRRVPMRLSERGARVALDPLLGACETACTLVCTLDNLRWWEWDGLGEKKWSLTKGWQERVTGVALVVICHDMICELYPDKVPWAAQLQALKSNLTISLFSKFRAFSQKKKKKFRARANVQIWGDTTIMVIASYVLLVDISLKYLWLFLFPAVAIAFTYMVCIKLCPRPAAAVVEGSSGIVLDEVQLQDDASAKGTLPGGGGKALKDLAGVPFAALLLMAQLDDDASERFAISQFLLFLSTTLGALTYMMTRLPRPGVAVAPPASELLHKSCAATGAGVEAPPASELLHKSCLVLLLLTAHTVAAEALGERVVVACLALEMAPLLLWFGVHLDRDDHDDSSTVVSVFIQKVNAALINNKPRRNYVFLGDSVVVALLAFLASMVVALLAFLASTSIAVDGDGSRLLSIAQCCGVSGVLAYCLVFMLRQWPSAHAVGKHDVTAQGLSSSFQASTTTSHHQHGKKGSRKHDKGTTATPDQLVRYSAGSSGEAVQLLKIWANALLIAAAITSALLLLKLKYASRLARLFNIIAYGWFVYSAGFLDYVYIGVATINLVRALLALHNHKNMSA